MNTTQISLDTFKNILRKDVETLCREEGLNYDKETDRGYAFQKWCANLLNNGVSAICTGFSIDEQSGEFVAKKKSIL